MEGVYNIYLVNDWVGVGLRFNVNLGVCMAWWNNGEGESFNLDQYVWLGVIKQPDGRHCIGGLRVVGGEHHGFRLKQDMTRPVAKRLLREMTR